MSNAKSKDIHVKWRDIAEELMLQDEMLEGNITPNSQLFFFFLWMYCLTDTVQGHIW